MSQIGTLAAATTTTIDISYLPQFVQLDDVDTALQINSLTVIGRGKTIIQLSDAAQIRALLKLESDILAAGAATEIASLLLLADGRIEGASTVTAANGAMEAVPFYANSLGISTATMARSIAVTPVIANGNVTFSGFDVLYFLPTNLDRVNITYANGWAEDLTGAELQGLYTQNNNAEAGGLIEGFLVVQGYRAPPMYKIEQIIVYAAGSGNVDVVVCAWQNI